MEWDLIQLYAALAFWCLPLWLLVVLSFEQIRTWSFWFGVVTLGNAALCGRMLAWW